MNIYQRMTAPTPRLFRVLRNLGVLLAGISISVLSAPVTFPRIVFTIAGYLAVAGGVLGAVSQLTVEQSVVTLPPPDPDPVVAPAPLAPKKKGRGKAGSLS